MAGRSIYVPLVPSELRDLAAMADDERRSVNDQAAHLISEALKRWRIQKDFEASLDADDCLEVA